MTDVDDPRGTQERVGNDVRRKGSVPTRVWIELESAHFDVAHEPPNDINPIPGHALLAWLAPRLAREGYETDGPDTEDWGWYLDVWNPTDRYLVGATACPHDAGVSWFVQIQRSRSLVEVLRGRGRITREDALARLVERLLREAPTSGIDVRME